MEITKKYWKTTKKYEISEYIIAQAKINLVFLKYIKSKL